MLMNERKRPIGSLTRPAPVSDTLRQVALLLGGMALAIAITAPGQVNASPGHHTGGHDHASPDHAESAHSDDDHAHGNQAHGNDDHEHDHSAADHAHGDNDHAHEDHAHEDHAHGGGGHGWQAPQEWVKRESPLEPDAETLALGQQVYQRYCSACHGPSGEGDGLAPASIYFDPSPTNLALHGAAHTVGEYAWLITEGGHSSAMPRYREKLEEDAIWSVVLYIRYELAGGQSADHQH